MTEQDLAIVDQIVRDTGPGQDQVVPILHRIQAHFHYLPAEALQRVCQVTRIAPATLIGVATFYDQFRHKPAGEHRCRVCHGTACHVRGAELLQQAIDHHLGLKPGQDTDSDKRYTVEKVACLGSCTMAPVMQLDDMTLGAVSAERVKAIFAEFESRRVPAPRRALRRGTMNGSAGEVRIGLGSCCAAKGSDAIYQRFQEAAQDYGFAIRVQRVGCVGACHRTPLVEVRANGGPAEVYTGVTVDDAQCIIDRHFRPGGVVGRLRRRVERCLDWFDPRQVTTPAPARDGQLAAFLGPQRHIATEHFGELDPLDLNEYIARDGFAGLKNCLAAGGEQVVEMIRASGLRGRGGAGFPSGVKWHAVRSAAGRPKYVICNGDEGDPGAFMDRMLLESFPYRIIEGMLIAAHAVGASEGIFYIRAEYPLALERVNHAIRACERHGLLGDHVLGADFPFHVSIRQGAGAFICGEETALLESIEGRRPSPRLRPPFPAESGYRGKPTLVNNVETLACVPWIMRQGPAAFAAMGTAGSKGTKVFALAGKVRRGGLIEVPMGVTIRQIVEEIGGGVADGRRFKAVQIGGPSGGCLPARLADTPIDYEALHETGAIMGSGGLVVLDDHDCMVDLARYFLQFTQNQSCGKCTFCRVGTRRMLDILERLCAGKGHREDLTQLEELAGIVQRGSLCGLGATAPNPVLTTLRYFRDEYEAHIQGRCPAGRCKALIHYAVNDKCIGCTICAQHCPAGAIPLTPYRRHAINAGSCTRCDVCRVLCPHDAIEVR